MKKIVVRIFLLSVLALTGCATSQSVTLATNASPKTLSSASLVPQEGNSAAMNAELTQQLRANGISIKPPLAAGTRQAPDIDMLVAYSDVWHWDLVMYLKSLDMNIFDAKTGNLIVTGRWQNSLFHGFQDYKQVMKGLMDEMMEKAKIASAKTQ